jgi:hypothetical protein
MGTRMSFVLGGATLALVIAAVGLAAGSPGMMGPAQRTAVTSFKGFYDGHKDTFLSTDVSSRSEARAEQINFSAKLAASAKTSEELYMFSGRTARGQLPVFSSEPGEKTYTPLWREEIVRWKPGVTPVLVDEDTQIDKLEKQGMITVKETGTILNCPIIKVRS